MFALRINHNWRNAAPFSLQIRTMPSASARHSAPDLIVSLIFQHQLIMCLCCLLTFSNSERRSVPKSPFREENELSEGVGLCCGYEYLSSNRPHSLCNRSCFVGGNMHTVIASHCIGSTPSWLPIYQPWLHAKNSRCAGLTAAWAVGFSSPLPTAPLTCTWLIIYQLLLAWAHKKCHPPTWPR